MVINIFKHYIDLKNILYITTNGNGIIAMLLNQAHKNK